MHSIADELEILGMMAAHESAIADLYRLYGKEFQQYSELFCGLVEDELKHARLIADLVPKVKEGLVRIRPGRFNRQPILASLDYVGEMLVKARKGATSLVGALSACVDLEEALIERKFFEIYEDDGPELEKMLETIATETKTHRNKVRQAWEMERRTAH